MSSNNCLMIFKWGNGWACQENHCVDNDWRKPRTDKGFLFKTKTLGEALKKAHKINDTEYGVRVAR